MDTIIICWLLQKTVAMVRDGHLSGAPGVPKGSGARKGPLSGPALQALKLKAFQAMVVWDLMIAEQRTK